MRPRTRHLILPLLLLVGCGYTGEASRIWVADTGDASRADSVSGETLDKLLDEVGYDSPRTSHSEPLIHGRLVTRLHYLATFPTRLVMLTNLAEQRIMSPNPVSEGQIGRPVEQAPAEAAQELSSLLASASAARRLYGLALLSEKGVGAHGGRLCSLLADRNSSVRSEAARLVGKSRHRPGIPGLKRMALSDPDEFNRICAMLALERVAGAGCLELVRRLALRGRSPFVRAKACGILAAHPDARSFRVLVDRLQRDREWLVRDEAAGAIEALTRIAIPRSAYRVPAGLPPYLARLRSWCRDNKIDVLF